MKKYLSTLLSIVLILGACVIPTAANQSSEVSYGSYYNFDFSQDNLYTDYTKNQKKNYGDFSYMPLASDGNTEVSYATINGKDALRIKTSGMTTLVPLKSDGTPFVMESGKSYTVNFTMIAKRSSARWSRCLFTPYSDINGEKAATTSSENVISYVKDDASTAAYGQRSLYGPGNTSNQWMYFDWVYNGSNTKLPAYKKSGTTFTADTGRDTYEHVSGYTINFNKVITIKSDGEMQELGVKVNSNGTYEKNGVTYNNFFAIELSGGSGLYTPGENKDAMVTAQDANGNPYYELFSDYYITNLEIISEDYVATTTLYNGEQKLATVVLENGYMKNNDVVIPTAPGGMYFSGWYYDKACTQLYDGKSSLGSTPELYAGFKNYPRNLQVSFSNYNSTADKTAAYPNTYTTNYQGYITTHGYAPKALSNGNLFVTTGTNSYSQNKDTLKYSSWGQSTVYVLRDENGEAFRLAECYNYTIKMKYKVTESSGKPITIQAGYGIPTSKAALTNLENAAFTYNFDAKSFTKADDDYLEYTSSFTVKEGTLSNNFAVAGIHFNIGSCNIDADTGVINAANKIMVESITIESSRDVTCNIEYNGGKPYRYTSTNDFPTVMSVTEGKTFEPFSAYKDGCKFAGWYIDEALTQTAEGTLYMENATYYAKWIMYGDCDQSNSVDTTDLAAMKLYLAGNGDASIGADCDDNGEIDTTDLAALKLYLAGNGQLGPKDDWRTHPEDFKLLAFTFDDGPDYRNSPSVSMEIADIFEENEGTATFFLIGQNLETDAGADIAKYLYLKGSELANHSYTHATAQTMDTMSEEEFNKEIYGTSQLIKNITGTDSKFFRGGGYAYNQRVYERLEELNMTAIGYHTSLGSDYSGGSATVETIISNIRNTSLPDGAVIIGHSSNSLRITPDALRVLLPELYNQGYRFCTMSELVQYKGLEYDDLPVHCYVNRIETKDDGSTKIHTQFRMYLDSWKTHPEDYKLLAFTFDDGPGANDTKFIDLFKKYKGSATFFVTGTSCNSVGYSTLQYAINNGWDIGNHSMTHADAWSGSGNSYTELTYEQLKYQICDFNTMLESNLTMADGTTPYKVSLYRPPQIRTTENVFKVCEEENMPIIWLSQNMYDWDGTKDYNARLKNIQNGVGTWIDGDVILGHVWSNDTYNAMVETFDAFYDAGYRFCSITELMEYRGIEISDISGKLNNVDGNNGLVRNIIAAATYGKATN